MGTTSANLWQTYGVRALMRTMFVHVLMSLSCVIFEDAVAPDATIGSYHEVGYPLNVYTGFLPSYHFNRLLVAEVS